MSTKVIVGAFLAVVVLAGVGFFVTRPKSEVAEIVSPVSENTPEPSPASGSDVTPAASQTYTLADVAKHAQASDCWLAIDNKVYNATEFVAKHPGGPAIIKGCGLDASKLFNERPTSNKGPHPSQAMEVLKTLYIGDLAT